MKKSKIQEALARSLKKTAPKKDYSYLETALEAIQQGPTFNFADEGKAAFRAMRGEGDYKTLAKEEHDLSKAKYDANPKTAMFFETLSSMLTPIPGATLAKGAVGAAKAAKSAATLGKSAKAVKTVTTASKKGGLGKALNSLSKRKGDIASGGLSAWGSSDPEKDNALSEIALGAITGYGVSKVTDKTFKSLDRSKAKESVLNGLRIVLQGGNKEVGKHHIERYLKNRGKINDAMSAEDITKIVNDTYNKVQNAYRKASDRLDTAKNVIKDMDVPDLTPEVKKAVKSIRNKGVNHSRAARALLPDDKKIPMKELTPAIQKRIDKLEIDGTEPQVKDLATKYEELLDLKSQIANTGKKDPKKPGELSLQGLFDFRKQLDNKHGKSMFSGSDASFQSDEATQAIKQIRGNIKDRLASEGGEKYQSEMKKAREIFSVLNHLDEKKILPKKHGINELDNKNLINFLKNISSSDSHTANRTKKIIADIDSKAGSNIGERLAPYEAAKRGLKTGKATDKDLAISPELKEYLESKGLSQKLKNQLDDDLKSPKKSQEFVESAIRKDPTKPRIESKRMFDAISAEYKKQTGESIDLWEAVKDRQTFDSFLKSHINGSRRTTFFRSIFGIAGRIGEAIGGAAGFFIDSEGSTMLKKALDKIIDSRASRKEIGDALYPVLREFRDFSAKQNIPEAITKLTNRKRQRENEQERNENERNKKNVRFPSMY